MAYVTKGYDQQMQVVTEKFRIVDSNSERLYPLKYRAFNQKEPRTNLAAAGFRVRALYGDFRGNDLHKEDSMMVLATVKNG